MNLGEKIRAIREAEGLTRDEFGSLLEIPVGTLRRYETGRIENIGGDVLIKIVNHASFHKYMNWLMTDKTDEGAGQIAPALSPDGQDGTSNRRGAKKAG
ncbi:MAG: helix-turn-helix domain-containing protein [Klebsiella pneumoniae]|uniref:helix-turn-helix domain-containing protein n=1 Tax=Klebsiella pneumoniae TaxID=573 RepID=UPI000E2DEB66|nr:helix-turn-helix domain-containing protein [Klebsiella pneumoniae]ELA2663162.1 helix-turn-helix domain-containing protein [Klebsiella pneumoniae]MBG9431659.1 helix-turn-helix domain-containing protein [Klebsiella pneumoniae]MCP6767688.1 helix-turn-helix domain-containing protein [Klebsiella pneumoniae]MDU5277781.1 helix-turn-helix domain-containing protein [Klebsiella pneumoniae]MDU6752606.1 helix-turn-helix domain-containing protein [Klebsiella pneumoniae]